MDLLAGDIDLLNDGDIDLLLIGERDLPGTGTATGTLTGTGTWTTIIFGDWLLLMDLLLLPDLDLLLMLFGLIDLLRLIDLLFDPLLGLFDLLPGLLLPLFGGFIPMKEFWILPTFPPTETFPLLTIVPTFWFLAYFFLKSFLIFLPAFFKAFSRDLLTLLEIDLMILFPRELLRDLLIDLIFLRAFLNFCLFFSVLDLDLLRDFWALPIDLLADLDGDLD